MLTVSDMAEGLSWNSVVLDLPALNDVTDLIQQVGSQAITNRSPFKNQRSTTIQQSTIENLQLL